MQKIWNKDIASKAVWLKLFGGCILGLWLLSRLIHVCYGTNDDMAMRDIASGAMTGTPNGHLIFVKYVMGSFLSMLYSFFPHIDWYGCLWLGFMCICVSLILYRGHNYCIEQHRSFFKFTIIFSLIVLFLGLDYFVNFQFTIVAGVLAGTAIFFFNTMEMETWGGKM